MASNKFKEHMNDTAVKETIYFIDVCNKKNISSFIKNYLERIAQDYEYSRYPNSKTFLNSIKYRLDNLKEIIDVNKFKKDFKILNTISNYIKFIIKR